MTEPDYKLLWEDAIDAIEAILENVDIEDINPVNVPFQEALYRAVNLRQYRRTLKGG